AEDYDYVMWAFVAHKSAFTGDPHNFPQQRMKRSHRTLQRILTETDPSTIQSFEFSASAKVRPWQTTNVTLLGDALHHMPPVGGMGGNAALNDANLFCQALLAVKSGQTLSDALHRCEAAMLSHGFDAVKASVLYTRLAISRIPFVRSIARMFF